MIGEVISYEKGTYKIKFKVPLYIEEAEAIPLNTWDRPDPGDIVYIFQDDELFGGQYLYVKQGSLDPDIHQIQTDTLEVTLDEKNDKLNVNYKDTLTLDIDLSGKKINLSFSGSELTIDTGKVHVGNSGNQPAVLFNEYEKRFKDLYSALASHKHGTSMGPSTPPLPPEVVKFQSSFPSTLSNDKSENVDIMK